MRQEHRMQTATTTTTTTTHLKLCSLVGSPVSREVRRDETDVCVGRVALDLLHLSEDELKHSRKQGDDGQSIPRRCRRLHLRIETLLYIKHHEKSRTKKHPLFKQTLFHRNEKHRRDEENNTTNVSSLEGALRWWRGLLPQANCSTFHVFCLAWSQALAPASRAGACNAWILPAMKPSRLCVQRVGVMTTAGGRGVQYCCVP